MSACMQKMQEYGKRIVELLSRRRIWIRLLIGAVVLLALIYVRFAFIAPVDHDEVEHAHVGFKVLNGNMPYRDFYQNHWPAYWLLSKQLVKAFPFSTHVILAGRGVNLIALAGCWLLGLRLLGSIRGGRTWLSLSIYTCAMITLACEMKFHEARPDPLMALIGTAGLCFIPARGNISKKRALMLGLLFGLSASVSIKMIPMALVVPALVLLHCIRDRRFQPSTALIPYGLGILLSLLPTAFWILRHGLFEAFVFDVFGLNSALSKPWYLSFNFLRFPVYLVSVFGIAVLFGIRGRRLNRHANGALVLALAMGAGLVLALLARHTARYNLQILIIPLSIGFASFLLHMCMHMRSRSYQLLLCAALLGYPTLNISNWLSNLRTSPNAMPQHELQRIIDQAKPGNRTCIAFSPAHPIFCRDISGLSNGWDVAFAELIRNPRQIERFRKLWHDGIRKTIDQQPDIILRRSPQNFWERAVNAGFITQDELNALDSLRTAYEVEHIGRHEVWVRHLK
jgi:hypothetical protein